MRVRHRSEPESDWAKPDSSWTETYACVEEARGRVMTRLAEHRGFQADPPKPLQPAQNATTVSTSQDSLQQKGSPWDVEESECDSH